jgi:hypothetical protein
VTAPAFVTAAQVREYLELNDPGSSSKYSDATIGSNIRAASYTLERVTHRWFADRTATTLKFTTNGAASVLLPGLRTATTVTMQGAGLTEDSTYWLVPDDAQSGVFTALQVRPFASGRAGAWWLSNPEWFDRNLDSPFYPANRGYGYTSLPNDLVIVGDWGYEDDDNFPEPIRLATKALAGYYTLHPSALLSGAQSTGEGNIFDLSRLPIEVQSFVAEWRLGQQAASVG